MVEAFNVDGDGVKAKSFREIRKAVAESFSTAFGGELTTDPGTPDGALVDLLAYALSEVAQGVQSALANVDVATAEGDWLDRLAAIAGLSRNDGETDAELRERILSAETGGLATYDGMLTYLRNELGVDVGLAMNCEPVATDGLPGHSVAVYVPESLRDSFTDGQIAAAIWHCKPAGVKAFGTVSGECADVSGATHGVAFSWITTTAAEVTVDITRYDEETLPDNYAESIKAAVAAWAAGEYTPGKDIIAQRIYAPVFSACSGILSVSVGVSWNGTSTTDGVIAVPESACVEIGADDVTVNLAG